VLIFFGCRYWLKTTNNCYVSRKHLMYPPTLKFLDNCGPIPHLEISTHNHENGTSDVDKREALPMLGDSGTEYLINVTVGEEYAYCRTCPQESCKAKKRYEFNQQVYLQCLERDPESDDTSPWWSQTTDFCYVKNTDFWESPEGDCGSIRSATPESMLTDGTVFRFPLCENFETPPDDEHGEEEDKISR
jgi:hypothetical protein